MQLKTKSNENEQNTATSDSRDEFHQFNVAQKKSCPRVQTTQIPFIELHKQVQLTWGFGSQDSGFLWRVWELEGSTKGPCGVL